MVKAIVVANSFSHFATYIRNRKYKREDYGFYSQPSDCISLDKDTPVHWLYGWNDSTRIKTSDINYLRNNFEVHKDISEKRVYSEGISF